LKNTTKRHKIYRFVIRTAIVNYVTPDYTERNLKFDIYDLLRSTQVFQVLSGNYLQYKLDKVMFAATPRQVDGTDPAPVWIYLDSSSNNMINYGALQELQGSKPLPVKHFSITSYSTTGRQNDFHYWYDAQTEASDLAIRLHSEATPTTTKYWQFQLGFKVAFRGFTIPPTNGLKVKEIKEIKQTESPQSDMQGNIQENDKLKGQGEEEEEEEELDWNTVDSDMEG